MGGKQYRISASQVLTGHNVEPEILLHPSGSRDLLSDNR